jgi:hypothetical protein
VLIRTNKDYFCKTYLGYTNGDYDFWLGGNGMLCDRLENEDVIAWRKLPKFRRKDSVKMTKIQLLGTIIVFLLWFVGMSFWVDRNDDE